MLRDQRQAHARQPVGDPRMDRLQSLDRSEQPQRPAVGRLDQSRIRPGQRRHVPARYIGDDQHLGVAGVIEWTIGLEMLRHARQMRRTAARLGSRPVASRAQRRRGHQHAMRLLQYRLGQWPSRVQPPPMDRHIHFTPFVSFDAQPIDKVGVRRSPNPPQQRNPRGQRPRSPRQAADRAFDPRARRRIEPVGCGFKYRLEPPSQCRQRPLQPLKRFHRAGRCGNQARIGLGQLGLEPIARLLRFRPRVDRPAHLTQQRFQRSERRALGEPSEPPVRRQRARRIDRRFERLATLLVVGRDIQQSRG